jgi:hypothetical protein
MNESHGKRKYVRLKPKHLITVTEAKKVETKLIYFTGISESVFMATGCSTTTSARNL